MTSDVNRFDWLVAAGLLLAMVLAASSSISTRTNVESRTAEESAGEDVRPNVLLLVADDLGYDDSTLYNVSSPARTPSLKELASEGVVFSRHYADSTCTPSRVSILTGMYAERMGFRQNGLEIPPEVTTLPEALRRAGYQTHLVGKWHAGEARRESLPMAQGFDTFFGFHNQWELSGELSAANIGRQRPTYLNPWLREGLGEMAQFEGHLTDILAERSLDIIRAQAGSEQPWFLYHGFLAPHTPIQPAERFKRKRPETPEGEYLALVDHLDTVVGGLVSALRETGQYDNTVVVFVSDNGGTNRERDNNFPWHGKKDETFEGSFRTPLLIRLPNGTRAGSTVRQTVMNTDILPTILSVAGGELPESLDGQNLLPVMLADKSLSREQRTWEKYIWNVDAMTYSFLSADGRWRLSNVYGFPPQLFDLYSHPTGDRDYSDTHASKVRELVTEFNMTSWKKSLLNVTASPGDEEDSTEYAGADMNRTPFRHSFSFGIEVPPHSGLRPGQPYAGQDGVWKLQLDDRGALQLNVGNMQLQGPGLNYEQCNDIVVTGHFQPGAMFVETDTNQLIKLYVNGQLEDLADSPEYEPPDLADVANPTVIRQGGRMVFSNLLLGAAPDPFNPRVAPDSKELFHTLREQGRLQRADIGSMRQLLCRQ